MTQRIDLSKTGTGAYQAVMGLETCIRHYGLEHSLIHAAAVAATT